MKDDPLEFYTLVIQLRSGGHIPAALYKKDVASVHNSLLRALSTPPPAEVVPMWALQDTDDNLPKVTIMVPQIIGWYFYKSGNLAERQVLASEKTAAAIARTTQADGEDWKNL